MRLIAFLFIACVIIAVARAVMPVLILTVISSLLWALITRPLELVGLAFILLLSQSISISPVITIVGVAFVIAIAVVREPVRPSGSNMGNKNGADSGKLDS